MSKTKETKNLSKTGGAKKAKAETLANNQKEPKSYKSVMKAFEITQKRLYPKLYQQEGKTNA